MQQILAIHSNELNPERKIIINLFIQTINHFIFLYVASEYLQLYLTEKKERKDFL